MVTLTDATLARRLLDRALAGKPELATADVDDLFTLAASEDDDGNTVYTAAALNGAAAAGWDQKAGLTANQYDLGGGPGKTLDRSQWQKACERRAASYRFGGASVVPEPSRSRSGLGSVGLYSSTAAEEFA